MKMDFVCGNNHPPRRHLEPDLLRVEMRLAERNTLHLGADSPRSRLLNLCLCFEIATRRKIERGLLRHAGHARCIGRAECPCGSHLAALCKRSGSRSLPFRRRIVPCWGKRIRPISLSAHLTHESSPLTMAEGSKRRKAIRK